MLTKYKSVKADQPAYHNIPETGFEVTNKEHLTKHVKVRINIQGDFKLSGFSAIQLITGAAGIIIQSETMRKLLLFFISKDENIAITLLRSEVKDIYNALKARMAHCEKERDDRSKNFNPDTYIAQKLLLLDLKEYLLGEMMEEGE
jgi:hypothetical protein